jgi:hypothetical protein
MLTVSRLFLYLLLTPYYTIRVSYVHHQPSVLVSVTYRLSCQSSQSRSLSAICSDVHHSQAVVPFELVALTVSRLLWSLSLTHYRRIRVSYAHCQPSVLVYITYTLSCHSSQSRSLSAVFSLVCYLRPIVPSRSVMLTISGLL